MNRQTLIGAVAGAVLVTGVGALAGYRVMSGNAYVDVLSSEEITRTVKTPREVCRDELVTRQKPVKDKHQVAGSVVGASIGGVIAVSTPVGPPLRSPLTAVQVGKLTLASVVRQTR